MSDILSELRYTKSHEWVRVDDENTAIIGITEYAVENFGKVLRVDLPNIGSEFSEADEVAVVEFSDGASYLYAPVAGKITAVNELLLSSPEVLTDDAYGEGWLYQMSIEPETDMDSLLDASAYAESLEY